MKLRDYEALLTVDPNDTPLRHDEVKGYRTKTTYAGDALEVDAYPICVMTPGLRRSMREGITSEAQQLVNNRHRERKLGWLMDANFGPNDIWMTTTYDGDVPDYQRAQADMRKFVRLARAEAKRQGKELKYIYAVGYEDEGSTRVRVHGHIIMTGIGRDIAESLWQKVHAGRVNAQQVQPGETGLSGLAKYFLKQHRRGRKWASSKNLTKPTVHVSDKKLSRRRVMRMARELDYAGREIMEKLYPDYRFVEASIKTSDFMPGAYVYVRMIRREGRKRHDT